MTKQEYGFYHTIEQKQCNAKIYIDLHNSRIKLTEYSGQPGYILPELIKTCKERGLGKIISTVYEKDAEAFINHGFVNEGKIDGYLKGDAACFLSYFADPNRAVSKCKSEEDDIIKQSEKWKNNYTHSDGFEFTVKTAQKKDAKQLASLFKTVFKTYPTPMDDPNYIKSIINDPVLFKIIEIDGQIVSAASADMDKKMLHAEMTDCATLDAFRGKGLLSELIYHLEQDLKNMGFIVAFSLARARSHGMNFVLSKHGYEYLGRQINNCDIMGSFEDMNIWAKALNE